MEVVMRASDIMTRRMVTVSPDHTILDAARTMLSERVNAALVCDAAGDMVGIVSEADLMRRPEIGSERERSWWLRAFSDPDVLARDYVRSHARKVRDAMTTKVIAADEAASLAQIADLFEQNSIKQVPVLRDGKPVGTVSRSNLLQALVTKVESTASAPASDAAIRAALQTTFESEAWADPWSKNVIVDNGVVHLWGMAQTDREKEACRVAAENVAGVKSVENHLVVRSMPMHAY